MIEDLVRMVLKLSPGVRKINHDLAFMRDAVKPVLDQLIPFQEEKEIELMSLKYDIKSQKQGLDKILRGKLYSIYYEPMVTFAYKDYVKGSKDALLYCRTKSSEFIFRIKKRDIDVYYDGHQVAIIDHQLVMHGIRSKSVLGRIKPYSNEMLSIIVKEKEVGQMFNPLKSHFPQQRVYSLIADLKAEEQGIFLSLTLYILITGLLSNKK